MPLSRKNKKILNELSYVSKLTILYQIQQQKKANINNLSKSVGLAEDTTRNYIQNLKKLDIVNSERDKRISYYSINYPKLHNFINSIKEMFNGEVQEKTAESQ